MPRRLSEHVTLYEGREIPGSLVEGIVKAVEGKELCSGIGAEYARLVLAPEAGKLLLVFRKMRKVGGFAMLREVRRMGYLDLICSSIRGAGAELMAVAEILMVERGMRKVRLYAVPLAEGFYRRLGYEETSGPCARKPLLRRQGDDENGYRYEKCLED